VLLIPDVQETRVPIFYDVDTETNRKKAENIFEGLAVRLLAGHVDSFVPRSSTKGSTSK
jgi:hypothetical protein